MKEGYVADPGSVPTEEELQKINRYTRRALSADEVYVFSVVLCDNEIDRDFERFSAQALHKMAELYVGKTGIFDHSMKGCDQVARIFDCRVETPGGQTTHDQKPYACVKARAYMPRTEKNKDLILEMDSGIKKEVSVGCAVGRVTCSICGTDQKTGRCEHRKGKVYHCGGRDEVCHHVLEDPTDAYEWSFVAVPAQPKAGVVKAFRNEKGGKQMTCETIVKSLQSGKDCSLTAKQAELLADYIDTLQKAAAQGEAHRKALQAEVLRLGGMAQPEVDPELMTKMTGGLSYDELCRMKSAFEAQLDKRFPPRSQFAQQKEAPAESKPCRDFVI